MKYCPYCGGGMQDDMRFCPNCGKRFVAAVENPYSDLTAKEGTPVVSSGKIAATFEPLCQTDPSALNDSAYPTLRETANTKVSIINVKKLLQKHKFAVIIISIVLVFGIVGGFILRHSSLFSKNPSTADSSVPFQSGFSDNTDLISQASKSVVMLYCYDRSGALVATASGFAAFADDIIVTNYHVIDGNVDSVTAKTEDGYGFVLQYVLIYSSTRDIAILQARHETGLSLLPIGDPNNLKKGEKVVAIGSPLGLINSVSTGVFSGYISESFGDVLQFTAAISPGSSGGALFNDYGEVIGITSSSFVDGQNQNLAIPITIAQQLYEGAAPSLRKEISSFYTPETPSYSAKDPYFPPVPDEIKSIISSTFLSLDEYKKERYIIRDIGLEEVGQELIEKGYRFFKITSTGEMSDRELQYYLDIALEIGLDEETAIDLIIEGYRFYYIGP